MKQIMIDFLNNFSNGIYNEDNHKFFYKKLPQTKLTEIISYILENNLSNNFITTDFEQKKETIGFGLFLVPSDMGGFRVFMLDKGMQLDTKIYKSIEEALFDYFDRCFLSFSMTPDDSNYK